MKKCRNIAKKIIILTFASILACACSEDEPFIETGGSSKENVPVNTAINFTVPTMDKVSSRALTENDESKVNDLYILVFNKSGKLKSKHYFAEGELPAEGGKLTLNTFSGLSLIYGIANVMGNELNGDNSSLKQKLDAIDVDSPKGLSTLQSLTATLTNEENISRSQASLVMSGSLECDIPETSGTTTTGKLTLRRLDSRITFKITAKMAGQTGGTITSFELIGWQVFNVPTKSYLIERADDATDRDAVSESKDYTDSHISIAADKLDGTYSFDFYLLENRKNALPGIGKTDYEKREIENKNSDGTNSGVYQYVEPHATYVEFKVKMELQKPDGGFRTADVKYVVHLGYVHDDATDFKNKRNKRYTYNISIEDVNKIITEVESDEELQPGAEGDVVDADTKIFSLDSHYSYLILEFKASDVKDLKFSVKTPFGEAATEDIPEGERANHDYKWLKFMRCKDEKTLASYPADKSKLIDLYGLEADIKEQAAGKPDYYTYTYTVFVDEYHYDKSPCANLPWSEPMWRNFVNKENRYALLVLSPKYSADQESSYAKAKYMITQRSIQTYYSTTDFTPTQTALGMEHENETGKPTWIALLSDYYFPWSEKNGLYNTYSFFKLDANANWNDKRYGLWAGYAQVNTYIGESHRFEIAAPGGSNTNMGAIEQCLSRNRDENGDGKIDLEELKWYLPASEELVGMYLGAQSLPSPLFSTEDRSAFKAVYKYEDGQDYVKRAAYHYLTSSGPGPNYWGKRIWAEEGASIGTQVGNGADGLGSAQRLRCVRHLGLDNLPDKVTTTNGQKPLVENVFESRGSEGHTLSIRYMNQRSMRIGKVENSELGTHDNNNGINAPYKAFRVAKDFVSNAGKNQYQQDFWVDFIGKNGGPCRTYSENPGQSDKGAWRIPNQRELMIMFMQNLSWVSQPGHIDVGAYCATAWEFENRFHFSIGSNKIYMDRANEKGGSYIRCVRDVEPNE